MTEYQEAMLKVAKVAMADLMGCSEPPEGEPDNYPFNACKHVDKLPVEWRADGERVITHVYHQEEIPQFCILP